MPRTSRFKGGKFYPINPAFIGLNVAPVLPERGAVVDTGAVKFKTAAYRSPAEKPNHAAEKNTKAKRTAASRMSGNHERNRLHLRPLRTRLPGGAGAGAPFALWGTKQTGKKFRGMVEGS